MSKRNYSSRHITLGRVAGVLAGTVLMSACSNNETTKAYQDVNACVADGVFSQQFCQTSYREAVVEHTRRAPRYQAKEDCQKDWDKCEDAPPPSSTGHSAIIYSGGRSYYQPSMSGYMLGRSGNADAGERVTTYAESVSKTTDGDMRSMTTRTAFDGFGSVYGRSSAVEAEPGAARPTFAKGSSISRGGFTTAARGFSIGG